MVQYHIKFAFKKIQAKVFGVGYVKIN